MASGIWERGKRWPIPSHPNCQVDTGGPHCVRREHEAKCLRAVRVRQAMDRAAQESFRRT